MMGIFSRNKENKDKVDIGNEKIPSSTGLHDPVLEAVREQQPWEVTNQAATQAVSPSGALRDVFGSPITNPDLSNPARSREERPLDTIRAFEYASTGDDSLRESMESHRLGFRPRQDFNSMPRFESNPYAQENVISFGDPNAVEERKNIYFPPTPKNTGGGSAQAPKKRGFFRRKEKN